MKTLLFTLFFACTSVWAVPPQFEWLIESLQAERAQINAEIMALDAPLLSFSLSPDKAKQGKVTNVFIRLNTGFTDSDVIVKATFDGQPVTLENPVSRLWTYGAGVFTEIKEHTLVAEVFVRDSMQAQQIIDAIAVLDDQIANEADPVQRDTLIAQRDDLIQALEDLQTSVGTQEFSFTVKENLDDPAFPAITRVIPNIGFIGGGTEVIINGTNFGANLTVKIGDVVASVVESTDSFIRFNTNVFSNEGLFDVEVSFQDGSNIKNAILKNAFYVTESSPGNPAPQPTKPFAVLEQQSLTINLGDTASLDGSGSNDIFGIPFSAIWRMVSKPPLSALPSGELLNNVANEDQLDIQPDVPGQYIVELVVEHEVAPNLSSEPALAIITVEASNAMPAPENLSFDIATDVTRTIRLQANDPDYWQTNTAIVTKQPVLGTASINASGVLTYTAGSLTGFDSLEVTYVDSGMPAQTALQTINFDIQASAGAPIVSAPTGYVQLTQGTPPFNVIALLVGENAISAPNGGIERINWDYGDGFRENIQNFNFNGISAFGIHDYATTGTFNAALTVTDNLGVQTVLPLTVVTSATDFPKIDVSVDTISGPAPLIVNFDASGTTDSDGIVVYDWVWNDGTPNELGTNLATNSHTFTNPGVYTVEIRAIDSQIAMNNAIISIYVDTPADPLGTAPKADYTVSPARQITVGSAFNLDATNSFDYNNGGSITNYDWNLPTGPSSGVTTSFSLNEVGNYFVGLSVTAASGKVSAPNFREVFVVNQGNAPRAAFRGNRNGVAPFLLSLDAERSYDSDGTIVDYEWSFDDFANYPANGGVVKGQFGPHVYNDPGVYFVGLKVTDNDGNEFTNFAAVTVNPSLAVQKENQQVSILQDDEQRKRKRYLLTNACARNSGIACHNLAMMYEEDGDNFTATKLYEKACQLGHAPACSSQLPKTLARK